MVVPGARVAPGDIFPRGSQEAALCAQASHPDWFYLAGLVALDAGAFWYTSINTIKNSPSAIVRYTGPVAVGLSWGATLGGAWLAMPKCSSHWVGDVPREGDVRETWPVALSLALLAGATAPMMNGIFVGGEPGQWSTEERAGHVIAAGVAGAAGALLPYLLPPRTWSAAQELRRLRVEADGQGRVVVGYVLRF